MDGGSLTVCRLDWTGGGGGGGGTPRGRKRSRRGCCVVRFHIVHINPICGSITLGVEHIRGHSQIPKDR